MKRSAPIFLAVLALLLASLACQGMRPKMSLENLRMAHDNDGEQAAPSYAPTDVFYAVADLKNAPQGTVVRAAWAAVDVPDLEEDPEFPEQTLDITDESFSGSIYFQLSNDFLWPTGRYRVDVYLNETLAQSLEFKVEEAAAVDVP